MFSSAHSGGKDGRRAQSHAHASRIGLRLSHASSAAEAVVGARSVLVLWIINFRYRTDRIYFRLHQFPLI